MVDHMIIPLTECLLCAKCFTLNNSHPHRDPEVSDITQPVQGQACERLSRASDPGRWAQPLPALSQGQRQHLRHLFPKQWGQ